MIQSDRMTSGSPSSIHSSQLLDTCSFCSCMCCVRVYMRFKCSSNTLFCCLEFYLEQSSLAFQKRDLRTGPIRGNFTEKPLLRSKLINSGVQRSTFRKIDPRFVEDILFNFINLFSKLWSFFRIKFR